MENGVTETQPVVSQQTMAPTDLNSAAGARVSVPDVSPSPVTVNVTTTDGDRADRRDSWLSGYGGFANEDTQEDPPHFPQSKTQLQSQDLLDGLLRNQTSTYFMQNKNRPEVGGQVH